MKIAIFGTGKFYEKNKKLLMTLAKFDEIILFLDNKFLDETNFDGAKAINPSRWKKYDFDAVIIMSKYVDDIRRQLLNLEVPLQKIYTWEYYRFIRMDSALKVIKAQINGRGKKILIITSPVAYDGASMAIIYGAIALRQKGFGVCLAAEYFVEELKNKLLTTQVGIAVIPYLPYIKKCEQKWIKRFDLVIVNVFPNIHAAYEIAKLKPVIWWIHESGPYSDIYTMTLAKFPGYQQATKPQNLHIIAVSEIAKKYFCRMFHDFSVGIMPYGILDSGDKKEKNTGNKVIFAIVGNISYIKGQDIFLRAIDELPSNYRNKAEFWMVGKMTDNEYTRSIQEGVQKYKNIKIMGELNRDNIQVMYKKIDVLISASREDSLPIVVTEGMMYGKPCIVPNVIGTAEFITDGEDGLIFSVGDVQDLKGKIIFCLDNKDKLSNMGQKAREIYENYFSMHKFADNIEREINICIQQHF